MISYKEFWTAYNNHLPSKLEEFYFKYFSTNTEPEDKWLTWVVFGIFFIPFIIGMIGTMANASRDLIQTATLVFACLLVPFALVWIYVWIAHNLRIRRIRKELGVSRQEYNRLVNLYY